MTQIVLIRHGITDWNIERRAQGQKDIPLNNTGREQAQALANRLRNEQWDMIYSSDLSRAKETADIIARELNLEVHTDTRLREINMGETEGTTFEERIDKWGDQWKELALGVEENESVTQRASSFLTETAKKFENKKILVVTHGFLIRHTMKKLVPSINIASPIYNTSVTTLTYADSNFTCDLVNSAEHLDND